MLRVFGATDTDFTSNGDIVLQPYKAKIHKEDNGDYYLYIEAGIEYANYLTANRIIVADTPQGAQAFRITNPSKTQNKISLRAWHVYYDSKNYVIADSNVVEKSGNDAINHLNSATDNRSPFNVSSNIPHVDSFRCVRKSLYEAFETLLERWGGHLVRDNFTVKLAADIGQDNGVTVRYKKNLREIRSEAIWDSVCTKILPVGSDGVLLNELYLYSPTQYDIPYTKVVSFSQNINEEDFRGNANLYHQALIDDLRKQATDYLSENCVPKVSYTLKANLEKLTDVGDTIEVIDERLGINVITHVTAYEYDCIQNKYTEVKFGNYTEKLSNLMNDISSSISKYIEHKTDALKAEVGKQITEASSGIWDVLNESSVIYEGNKILIVDRLPKDTAKNVIMINSHGISFSKNGIDGEFKTAWTIGNTLDLSQVNIANLKADLIKGGTLDLSQINLANLKADLIKGGTLDLSQINLANLTANLIKGGTLDLSQINLANLTANLIKGGTLKLGSSANKYGSAEVYDQSDKLIAKLDNTGVKTYGDSFKINDKNIFDMIYPVGAIYISVNNVNPSVLFGGTWEQIQDRFLLGAGSTYSAGSTGGEANHTLTQSEIPSYPIGNLPEIVPGSHVNWANGGIVASNLGEASPTKPGVKSNNNGMTRGTQYSYMIYSNGGGKPHNNMPPYLAVYIWKRVN
ncbi:putative antireceptor [Lactobacillus phage c5]|uniref:Antireceptor n=1 Tax=Lactobacillus phage c5 TaxID=2892341 RepID=F8J176_9CAUD|nr:minor head protein [Lactobacillus phage c5]ACA63314.1 putative antireceptor [Lactobacillus phage c5]